ncbi:MAG: hypothetical protein LBC46_02140, partial [Treponema sp.]|nr:hypothetical protein [Treponema sp.]
GVLAYWRTGVLAYWRTGVLAYWRTGVLAWGEIRAGGLGCCWRLSVKRLSLMVVIYTMSVKKMQAVRRL